MYQELKIKAIAGSSAFELEFIGVYQDKDDNLIALCSFKDPDEDILFPAILSPVLARLEIEVEKKSHVSYYFVVGDNGSFIKKEEGDSTEINCISQDKVKNLIKDTKPLYETEKCSLLKKNSFLRELGIFSSKEKALLGGVAALCLASAAYHHFKA